MLFSQIVFDWILTIFVIGMCSIWIVYDGRLLLRLLADRDKRGDLAHRDKVFGSVIGLVVSVLGLLGVANFQLGWGW